MSDGDTLLHPLYLAQSEGMRLQIFSRVRFAIPKENGMLYMVELTDIGAAGCLLSPETTNRYSSAISVLVACAAVCSH